MGLRLGHVISFDQKAFCTIDDVLFLGAAHLGLCPLFLSAPCRTLQHHLQCIDQLVHGKRHRNRHDSGSLHRT